MKKKRLFWQLNLFHGFETLIACFKIQTKNNAIYCLKQAIKQIF